MTTTSIRPIISIILLISTGLCIQGRITEAFISNPIIKKPMIATRPTRPYNDSNNFSLFSNKQKPKVEFSTPIPALPSTENLSATSLLDYLFTIGTSDLTSIVLGSIGIILALFNRLSSIDYEATSIANNVAADMGAQSRQDLLAVFSAGAVLLNGLSKLDVTSALAESVALEGFDQGFLWVNSEYHQVDGNGVVEWAMGALRQATPAKTAALLVYTDHQWNLVALDGIIPNEKITTRTVLSHPTPILDRFLKGLKDPSIELKESYLPTLQALPGKVEFTYLPSNTQGVLCLPIRSNGTLAALVLGSDTAKSFTPRDVAWSCLVAARIGDVWDF
jgi:hypothetical protein